MDHQRFDRLTKTFVTRRTGLGLGLASLLGFSIAKAEVTGQKKKCQPECPVCKQCKKGKCKTRPNGTECGANGLCRGGKCVACPAGRTRCDEVCVDLTSDPDYCGTCDIACGFDQSCDSGACCGSEGAPCTHYSTCCSQSCDSLVGGGTCGSSRGQFCNAQYPCHEGYACTSSHCDGCIARAEVCNGSVPCCNSDCAESPPGSGKACLSNAGGRCVNNPDCRACYTNSANCSGACVGGTCQF